MKKRLLIAGSVLLVIIVAGVVLGVNIDRSIHAPEHLDDQQTIVVGSPNLVPGTDAAMRVVVQRADTREAIEGATLTISLAPTDGGREQRLYEGKTNAQGTADISFHVPEDAPESAQLIVESRSDVGQDRLEQTISTQRSYKILLTTDKPIYQPGQTINLRALALSTFDLTPARTQSIEFVITDGKGNRVFRDTVTTSDFGVAAVDFKLATQVNTGPYKITAVMGDTSSEKTVTVEPYVLPKYKVTVTPDRDYYLPGEHVTAHLQADYFFGKPVNDAQVLIEGFTFDVAQQVVVSIDGVTDANGGFDFEFDLPTYIAGSELEGGQGRFYMQATVTDQTNHSEESSISLPVSQNSIIVEAIPESGVLRIGVENIVYIICSYPDGTPAPSNLTIQIDGGQTETLSTGEYGLAEYRFTPTYPYSQFYITATDAAGHYGEAYTYSEGEYQEESVLLRPEKAAYRVGDTMQLDILTSARSGTVYLDMVREAQTVSTRSVEIHDGHGSVSVDLTPDLYGTLELHAYKILASGSISRDTRLVLVDAPTDLSITVSPNQQVYRPGDTANIAFQVSDSTNTGVPSVLGLAMVDESVFALAEQDPGFAKLYFMLEAELLQPRYELHGFSIPDLLEQPSEDQTLLRTQNDAAQASLAGAGSSGLGFQIDSSQIKAQLAYERRADFFNRLVSITFPFLFILPVVGLAASVFQIWREHRIKYSLKWTAIGLGIAIVLALALVGILSIASSQFYWYGLGDAEGILLIIPALALLALIATGIIAMVRGDWTLAITALALLLYAGAILIIVNSLNYANFSPDAPVAIGAIIAFIALPLAFGLRAAGFGQENRRVAAAAAAFVAVPLMCVVCAFLVSSPFMMMGAAPTLDAVGGEGAVFEGDILEMAEPQMIFPQEAGGAAMTPTAAAAMDDQNRYAADGAGGGQAQGAQPPRLRQYFPETMYWNPEVMTDAQGAVALDIPMADSITTWRLSALASSQDGRLGATTSEIRVFQDFFIDLDLPLALTQNDEVAVPVGVFNYLQEAQDVRLVLEAGDWYTLDGEAEQTLTIQANDIGVVYFRIKVVKFGTYPLTVTAYGQSMSDAIQKQVTVYPDGKQIDFSVSDRLPQSVDQSLDIPASAVPGTSQVVVKIYPGVVSQVVEGLDSILQMPSGCFEQTSSTTYPNVLVLDYLKTTGQISPETQFKAEDYINIGYQRLTTFEVSGGGFSLFGEPPGNPMLTAYGLLEFSDMSKVHDVDEALIRRSAEWLLAQQDGDGSWDAGDGFLEAASWNSLQNDRLPVTAYIVWSLVQAGYQDDARVQAGLTYIRDHQSEADEAYVLALVANALVAGDPQGSSANAVLDQLAAMAQYDGDAAYWGSDISTFMGSEGETGSIEITALVTYALLRAEQHPDLANAGLTYLIRNKDTFGTWYNTQATVLSLKAMLESVRVGGEDVNATVNITLNDGQAHTLQITPENFDVVQMVVFDDVDAGTANSVHIDVQGEGDLMYQISGSYYLPWSEVPQIESQQQNEVSIDVSYDRTELSVDDTVQVMVDISLNEEGGTADWALIDLGIPPGFSVVAEDLNALVAQFAQVQPDGTQTTIERYELTGRQILIYIGNLRNGQPLQFSYRLRAKYPIVAQTPASSVYDYYNPTVSGYQEPEVLTVSGQD